MQCLNKAWFVRTLTFTRDRALVTAKRAQKTGRHRGIINLKRARSFRIKRGVFNIGAREVYYPQIQKGSISILPEYNGALLTTSVDQIAPSLSSLGEVLQVTDGSVSAFDAALSRFSTSRAPP